MHTYLWLTHNYTHMYTHPCISYTILAQQWSIVSLLPAN